MDTIKRVKVSHGCSPRKRSRLIEYEYTVNSKNFAIISQISLKDLLATLKIATRYALPISVIDSVISRGFHFHETSHMRSFAKINPRENIRIYSNEICGH